MTAHPDGPLSVDIGQERQVTPQLCQPLVNVGIEAVQKPGGPRLVPTARPLTLLVRPGEPDGDRAGHR